MESGRSLCHYFSVIGGLAVKLSVEEWSLLALVAGVGLTGIVGGHYYSGWNPRDIYVDNDTRGLAWLITLGEVLAIWLLWKTRPWHGR